MLAPAARVRKPSNDCFLTLFAFDLEPRGASTSGLIRARSIFGQHALEPLKSHQIEKLFPMLFHVVAENRAVDRTAAPASEFLCGVRSGSLRKSCPAK